VGDTGHRVYDHEGWIVAVVGGVLSRYTPDEDKAHARLIAAAPDLLAACEYLTTLIVEGGNGEGWTLTEAYDRASEAIAKARGES
jgi:hypothetical protein